MANVCLVLPLVLLGLLINGAIASKMYYKDKVDVDNAWTPYYLGEFVGLKYENMSNKESIDVFTGSKYCNNS